MKRVLIISTGGTIASIKTENGLVPGISSTQLLEYLNIKLEGVEIDTLDLLNIDSTDIRVENWILIAKTIEKHYENYDGFVVTHGTDTLAYTAAALSYLIQNSRKPIVITGAQKSISNEITDAKMNLVNSITYASSEKSNNVVIVFNGKVIAGTRGRKEKTKSYDAFSSLNYPVLATIQDNKIIRFIQNEEKQNRPDFYFDLNNSVFLLKLIPTIEGDILDFIFEHYTCIIIESYGVGGIPKHIFDKFIKLSKKYSGNKIIVITTQVPMEGSDLMVYEVGQRLKGELSILESFDMTIEATVVKLMWAMAEGKGDYTKFKELFNRQINYDTLYDI
ncbi:asparaginase [Miniphocaeibacter halophilus]|uniref:Asparaginase n=1 Tax=Miniphocaeibacter halophilus TaxID=2931922 RepID=A0AC61MRA8_9FIRM|nr:asparaginase [Miniphocaeibacter halophilus]QQK08180.1 asparaginase [Miniphocaeibacter halophilus]